MANKKKTKRATTKAATKKIDRRVIGVVVSSSEYAKIKRFANNLTDGNVSAFMRDAALNA